MVRSLLKTLAPGQKTARLHSLKVGGQGVCYLNLPDVEFAGDVGFPGGDHGSRGIPQTERCLMVQIP